MEKIKETVESQMKKVEDSFRDGSWMADEDESWGPQSHLSELMRLKSQSGWSNSFLQHAKESTPFALARFATHGITNYIYSFVLAPASVFGDPLSTLTSLIIYPVIFVGLFIVALDPTIFNEDSNKTIDSAIPILEGAPTTIPHSVDSTHKRTGRTPATTRLFSLPLARTFLLMSAIVYERNDQLVQQAADAAVKDPARGLKLYLESHKRIKKQAKRWNLHYEAISSMSTISGPFASVFYPKKSAGGKPWMALVFKGTSAASFAEILVDANITRVPSSVYYGAGSTCHEGFFDDLFPSNTGGPDGTIRTYLKALAAEMCEGYEDPEEAGKAKIPLWVTGHSLGSALASLIYARFVQSPGDLGEQIELRDCYSYGTPRLGDGSFAASFERNLVTPVDRPNVLWRVVNHFDIVCQVPPGLADSDHSRATLGLSVLNYSHIGTQVQLSPVFKPFYSINSAYFRTTTHSLLQDSERPEGAGLLSSSRKTCLDKAGWNPLRMMVAALPSPMYDHFPASYLCHLNMIDINQQIVPSTEDEHTIAETAAGGKKADKGKPKKLKGHWGSAAVANRNTASIA